MSEGIIDYDFVGVYVNSKQVGGDYFYKEVIGVIVIGFVLGCINYVSCVIKGSVRFLVGIEVC